ncbi:MAG: hypothetical protein ACR2MO_01405 [Acidimicrobiales bacterium]
MTAFPRRPRDADQPVAPSGMGYWPVAADGGVFAFGDARFAGPTGGMRPDQPVVGLSAGGS